MSASCCTCVSWTRTTQVEFKKVHQKCSEEFQNNLWLVMQSLTLYTKLQMNTFLCFSSPVGRVHSLRLLAGVGVYHLCHHGLFLHLHWPNQDRGPVWWNGAWREGEEEKLRHAQERLSWEPQRGQEEFWFQLWWRVHQTDKDLKQLPQYGFPLSSAGFCLSCLRVPVPFWSICQRNQLTVGHVAARVTRVKWHWIAQKLIIHISAHIIKIHS